MTLSAPLLNYLKLTRSPGRSEQAERSFFSSLTAFACLNETEYSAMSGSEGEDHPAAPHPPPPLHSSWNPLASLGSAGGGRVDATFLTEPGSYEGALSFPLTLRRSLAEAGGIESVVGRRRRRRRSSEEVREGVTALEADQGSALSLSNGLNENGAAHANVFLVSKLTFQPRADFHYPSPFDYSAFTTISPGGGIAGGSGALTPRPFSPFHSHHRLASGSAPSNPFSPLPSFGSYSAYGVPSPAFDGPPFTPAPPTPPPLFDEGETALFSSFLNTLDVDPGFLFNPVLPPGMPSPPSASMLQEVGAEETAEREQLGMGVGGLSIGGGGGIERRLSEASALPPLPSRDDAPLPPRFVHAAPVADEHEEETVEPDEDDEDSDFELKPPPRAGARRKSSSGGGSGIAGAGAANGRNGKKARVQAIEEHQAEEDVEMAAPNSVAGRSLDDGEETATPSGRPRRQTRAPRRLSNAAPPPVATTSASSSVTRARKPSLSRPPLNKSASSSSSFQPAATPAPTAVSPPRASTSASASRSRSRSISNQPAGGSSGSPQPKPTPLTESEKRSNHIASEQRRRNAIRSGFQDLVDLLVAGSAASGIVLGAEEGDGGGGTAGKKKKGTGRGRGRKGEVATNASKSVVLAQAANYILWLERGNRALEKETGRVEGCLEAEGVGEG